MRLKTNIFLGTSLLAIQKLKMMKVLNLVLFCIFLIVNIFILEPAYASDTIISNKIDLDSPDLKSLNQETQEVSKVINEVKIPKFSPQVIEPELYGGYWVEAFDINSDSLPDLMSFGLTQEDVTWHKNPDWLRLPVAKFELPVGMDHFDVNKDGHVDGIICYEIYGEGGTIQDVDPNGGKIAWLENPGTNYTKRWTAHLIGNEQGMHRIRAGHFTRNDKLEVLGFPIALKDTHAIVNTVLFTEPNNRNQLWDKTIIDDTTFRVIHGVEKKEGLIPGSNLQSIIMSSSSGIHWLFYDTESGNWIKHQISKGELEQYGDTGYRGSGNVDVGKIGNDNFGYVAASEPFHGNTLAVYTKPKIGSNPLESDWKRHVLDIFGDPNENGEGPSHQIICKDFDGDGDDEFLLALRGPSPWKGVFYYKAIDPERGIFVKWKVSEESAARIAVADFNGDDKLDFATIGYVAEGYYEEKYPKLIVFFNKI